jgi:type IX secretion system PorP/SprF family membrane protein
MSRFFGLQFPLVIFLLTAVALQGLAQELTSSQYYSNLPNINPAFTGIDEFLDLKMGFYQGWNSFDIKNNNFYVSAYSSLNSSQRNSVRNNALRISTSGEELMRQDKRILRKHGMGGILSGRNVGPYRSLTLGYNYAYHIPLSNKINFSFGTKLAYFSQRIDFSGFTVRNTRDPFFEQLISTGNAGQSSFLMDFGLVTYSENFYLALSSTNLINGKFVSDNSLKLKEVAAYHLYAAGNVRFSQATALNTGLRLTLKDGNDLGWSINTRLRYKELLYVGGGLSNNSQLSLLFGITINTSLNIHYSYDQYLSSLSDFNVNAHEFVLGINVFNRTLVQPKFW